MSDTITNGPSGAVLDVRDLAVSFGSRLPVAQVVTGVSFSLERGRTLGLVGESGCGKTSVAKAIMGLICPPVGHVMGTVHFRERNLLELSRRQLTEILGRHIAMIFQEPMNSLNPAYTVGDQIAEVIRRHEDVSRKVAWKRAVESLDHVRIPGAARRATEYPHQFSGGMCQRIMMAMAIACRPAVLIADEPTTALDVTVQAQVLKLLKELQQELGLAILFITHDLGVVAEMCDDVAVMYAGEIVEQSNAVEVFLRPNHPYTDALLAAIPNPAEPNVRLTAIDGRVPPPTHWPKGCRFNPRCAFAVDGPCTDGPIALVPAHAGMHRCIRASELTLEGVRHAGHA